jgi:hypothetical protein
MGILSRPKLCPRFSFSSQRRSRDAILAIAPRKTAKSALKACPWTSPSGLKSETPNATTFEKAMTISRAFAISSRMGPFGSLIDTAAIVNQATELKCLSASVAFDQTLERKIERC